MRSDAELVAETLAGSTEAYAVLVRQYERAVLAVAFSVLRRREASRDVAQEVFWTAYDKLASLRTPTDFGKWLLQIARNRAISEYRRLQRALPMETLPGGTESALCDEEERTHEELLDAIVELPEGERQVVLLRYFDGLTVAEIGTALGRPVGTVTKQLSRAYARLRSTLSNSPGEDVPLRCGRPNHDDIR